MKVRHVLIALDNGPIADHALDVGLELAKALESDVALVHVVEPSVPYGTDSGIPNSELMELSREGGQKLLAGIREHKSLPPAVREFLEGGNPATQIVKVAGEWPASMIVIGSHGRSGLSRFMLGSVAEAVVRKAPCPVLVVRTKAG